MTLPAYYPSLSPKERAKVREQYVEEQEGFCMYCHDPLSGHPAKWVRSKRVDWSLFPQGFRDHPIHLQHNHETGMTEGAVHMRCNAVMWQYEHR